MPRLIDTTIWRKAWALLDRRERRNAGIVLAIVILSAFSSAVMVGSVMPFLTVLADPTRIHTVSVLSWVYSTGGFTSDFAFLVALGAASLLVIIVANLIQILRTWAVARFTLMRMHTISHRLLASYLRQPYEYFLDHHSGEMSTQILAESQEVTNRFFRPAGEAVSATLTVIAIVALLLWVNPVVALIAFAVLGSLYGGTFVLSRRIIAREGQVRAASNRARYRLANEALGGVKDIKLLGREASYVDRYQVPSLRMVQSIVIGAVVGQVPQYVMQAVGFGGVIILCLILLKPSGLESGAALGGILPLLGVFAFAGQRLLPELSRLYQSFTQLTYGAAAVGTVYRDLVATAEGDPLPGFIPAPLGFKKELRLNDVTYRYPRADRAGLSDVTLTIAAGEKIGVVGSTGAGKTTLADVILGLLRPSQGCLVVDGITVTDGNLRAWQQTVGYVPQDIFLTDASVAENIALGVSPAEIDLDRVRRAARIAHIDAFVMSELAEGYDTLVGERGVRLSGGQRQRIGIARALYHDADLIVFDEATSALDNLTEAEVMTAIDALPGDKTVVLIAHRLSTVKRCNRIAVLDQGRVVGCDAWSVLVTHNASFQRIARVANSA
ncbi:ABC transporter ATP-binding protein [Amorphus sp. 3PC139-8]|uniref:ABC transporter ATP-binding protein n=1 Tax=Amorphus sp. 3PC139-8 TaxID=2735676 RepID=UPI00345CE942